MMPKKETNPYFKRDGDIPSQAEADDSRYQAALKNCRYFIEEFVYIESKDSPTGVTPFVLWPRQKKTLIEDMLQKRFLIFLKARQLGCTWLVLAYSLWLMLRPAKRIIALSKTEDDAWALVNRVELMVRHLPPWFIKKSTDPIPGTMTYDNTMSWVKIRHPSGEDSIFTSLPAAQNSGASLTADVVIFDEWGLMVWAEQIYRAAFPTINRAGSKPENGQVFGISTMRLGSFFHRMVLRARAGLNSYKLIFWPWDTDPSRDQAWYERSERDYPGNMKSDYPATIEEALSQAEGCFFSELDHEIHVKEPLERIPDNYTRYAAIDYGLDGLAVKWYWQDELGRCRAYRELYAKDKTIGEAAGMILAANNGDDLDGFFAPPDLWNRRQETGKSFTETFAEHDIFLTKADNDRERGLNILKEMLRPFKTRNEQTGKEYTTALLTFDAGACPETWRCMTTIQRDPKNYNDVFDKPGDQAIHELTHLVDETRYFAVARTTPAVKPVMGRKRDPWEQDEQEGEYIKW